MNKEQTALDVSRDIELNKVMPQQAAQTLTDEQIQTVANSVFADDSPLSESELTLARTMYSYGRLSPASQPAVPAMPVAWLDSLAMTVARLEEDAEMFDQCGQNSTAEDRRARAYEITQMLAAAPKVDAAVPADLGAREQIAKLEKVSKWIDQFPVPTTGATAMMILLKQVQDALAAASQGAQQEAEPVAPNEALYQAVIALSPESDRHIEYKKGHDAACIAAAELVLAAPAVALQEAAQPVAKQFPVLTAQEYYDRHCIADDNDREAFDDALDADAMLELRDRTLEEAACAIECKRHYDTSTARVCAQIIRALKNDPAQQDSKEQGK